MNQTTFLKIQAQRLALIKLASDSAIVNFELFDEPYILAIKIIQAGDTSNQKIANKLGVSIYTVKQCLRALDTDLLA